MLILLVEIGRVAVPPKNNIGKVSIYYVDDKWLSIYSNKCNKVMSFTWRGEISYKG